MKTRKFKKYLNERVTVTVTVKPERIDADGWLHGRATVLDAAGGIQAYRFHAYTSAMGGGVCCSRVHIEYMERHITAFGYWDDLCLAYSYFEGGELKNASFKAFSDCAFNHTAVFNSVCDYVAGEISK